MSYAIVSGSSMEPALHRGDLVVVRPAGGYRVGDVVAYRTEGGATVLHRIVGRAGDRYVLQGDANSWLDPFQPADEHILGRLQRDIPGVGLAIDWLRQPIPASVLVGVVSFLVGVRHQRRVADTRKVASVAVVVLAALVALPTPALSKPNSVPASRLGRFVQTTDVNWLKPSLCASLTLTTLKVGSGGTLNGTSANELLLGTTAKDTINAGAGNDCLVGGANDDTLDGGNGTDVCLGGAGSNTYTNRCETKNP